MSHLLPLRATAAALGLMLLASTTVHAQFDTVFGAKGTPDKGSIVQMTPTQVVIDIAGRQVTHEVKDIRKVTFADDSAELQNARDAVLAGQLEQALEDLNRLNPANITRQVVKEDVIYYKAYADARLALQGRGNQAAAETNLLNFVRSNSKTYHFYEAAELLGDLASAQANWDKAAAYYGSLSNSGWPEYQLRSDLLVAQVLVNQGKFKEAAAKYDAVIKNSLSTPEADRMKLLATVGKAKCVAEAGQPQQAVPVIENIIAKNDPKDSELFARAYNALGDAYRKLDQPEDALLAYLHTDVLFFSNSDAHAEALYRLNNLWTQQNQNDRALQTRNLLNSRYSSSRWANQN
jgi:tetratricopeptide (TPR) repeat protein